MDKTIRSADEAVADIAAGNSVAVGGFGIVGTPIDLIKALARRGVNGLHIVSNNCGVRDLGLGLLLKLGLIDRVTLSFIGGNVELNRQMLSGLLELELVPQGTLAERLRAAGAGIGAFYTPTGFGTQAAEGGIPTRYSADGQVLSVSDPKPTALLGGTHMVLERALQCDFALVHAHRGDRHGNLTFRRTARNFNPVCAMAGAVTIAQVEELVDVGELDPDAVHLPGVFVDRIVEVTSIEKPFEKITLRQPKEVDQSAVDA
jgi:3-oxoacid CoA-transferase subunit A